MKIETAIVDGADEMSDHDRGVFRLSEIDDLLETDGAAESIRRVQDELAHRCRTLAGGDVESGKLPDANPSADDPVPPADELASVVPLQAPVTQQPRFGYARRPGLH